MSATPRLSVKFETSGADAKRLLRMAVTQSAANILGSPAEAEKLAAGTVNLPQLRQTVHNDLNSYLGQIMTGRKTGTVNSTTASQAMSIHRRFGAVSPATERIHRMAVRRAGTFYNYMQRRRANKAERDEQAANDRAVEKVRKRDRNKARARLDAKLKAANATRAATLKASAKSQFTQFAPVAQSEVKYQRGTGRRPLSPNQAKRLPAGAVGSARSKYLNTGRMATRLLEMTFVEIQGGDLDDSGVLRFTMETGVKDPRYWSDREAGLAFFYMSKRPDSGPLLEDGIGETLNFILMDRLQRRMDARSRPTQVKGKLVAAQAKDDKRARKAAEQAALREAAGPARGRGRPRLSEEEAARRAEAKRLRPTRAQKAAQRAQDRLDRAPKERTRAQRLGKAQLEQEQRDRDRQAEIEAAKLRPRARRKKS